ncbi:MAG: tRNA (N6-threonylcarbamoyladenosine(37)-N6)-methyltransferase TrmO [Bacteroidales bacterium]
MMKQTILLIAVASLNLLAMNGQEKTEKIVFEPIGIFHTPYTPETGAPRQGILEPDVKGSIELFPEYHGSLASLDLYDHIIVLYHFSEVRDWRPTARPPKSDGKTEFGLFATRTPGRPNPIGLTVVKLEKVEDGILYISGPDAFDGTPVLDIKPYVRSIDCIESSRDRALEKRLGL